MTQEQEKQIADELRGTCDSGIKQADEYGVELEDIEEACLNQSVERYSGCEWWFDSFDLVDDDMNVVGCEQCR